MIVKLPTFIRIDGVSYDMRAGTFVPAPVISFWRATGELARLQTMGAIEDDAAPATEPRAKVRKKDDAESV